MTFSNRARVETTSDCSLGIWIIDQAVMTVYHRRGGNLGVSVLWLRPAAWMSCWWRAEIDRSMDNRNPLMQVLHHFCWDSTFLSGIYKLNNLIALFQSKILSPIVLRYFLWHRWTNGFRISSYAHGQFQDKPSKHVNHTISDFAPNWCIGLPSALISISSC